jgi:hypothetical protein
MKRYLIPLGLAAVFLLASAALTSGEKIVSSDKAPAANEKAVTAVPDPVVTDEDAPRTNARITLSPAGADAYEIPWQSINAGGEDMTSANYQMLSSVGQSVIGYTSSANYAHGIGYWYGTETSGGDCFCGDPVGDANCDAAMNPVDVVYMVNFVYKNLDARCYPVGWNCPYDLGDVNCDNGINPVDVVYYVNYVYKNLNAFCDPCVD